MADAGADRACGGERECDSAEHEDGQRWAAARVGDAAVALAAVAGVPELDAALPGAGSCGVELPSETSWPLEPLDCIAFSPCPTSLGAGFPCWRCSDASSAALMSVERLE